MANSLGQLTVQLGLDAAEFVSGLSRSEYQAKKFADSLSNQVAVGIVKAELALKLLGEAASFAVRAFPELISQAGHFQDLAEKTGASAEALASFSIAAQVAGKSVDDIATFSVKLSKNLVGVGEDSSKTALALKSLGIPIKEFKELDPAAQIDLLSKALSKFNDIGGGKAAVLENIAKGGADLLPFLKELEESGGRQITLTKEQIRQADAFADATARSKAQLNAFAQFVAVESSGAVAALTKAVKDFVAELLGLDATGKNLRDNNAIADFANNAVRALAFIADSADSVSRIFRVVGNVIGATAAQMGALADGDLKRYNAIQKDASDVIDGIIAKQTLRFRLEKNIADQAAAAKIPATADTRPRLPIPNAPDKGGGAEKVSEAQRYLESLEKQLQGTLDLSVAETALVQIYDLRAKGVKGLTSEMEATIMDYARQIDAAKDLKKAQEDAKRQADEEARIRERNSKDMTRRIESAQKEAQTIRDSNEQIQEQIAFLRGGEAGLRAYTDAKLAKAIAENLDKEAMLANAGASKEEIEAIHDITKALQERKAQLGQLDLAKQFAAEAKALQDVKNALSDAFANSFADFISGAKTAKEAIKSFADDVVKQVTRVATQNIGNAIFGGKNEGGPDFFGVIGKLLGFGGGDAAKGVAGAAGAASTTAAATALTGSATALAGSGLALDTSALGLGTAATGLGAAAAALTAAAAAMSVSSAASGVGDIFGSALSGLAAGGGLANGTNYARGGFTVVAEHGPELIDLPRGARVRPMNEIGKAGNVYNINIATHVMPGATTASVKQTKQMVRDAVMSAVKER